MANKAQSDHQRLKDNVKMIHSIVGSNTICNTLHISIATWYRYAAEPWQQMSYNDFCLLAKLAGVTPKSLIFGTLKVTAEEDDDE